MERLVDINLVAVSYKQDAYGQEIMDVETTRTLTATISSLNRAEWSAAAQAGLNPEGVAFLRDSDDYEDEQIIEVNGTRFIIYRTFMTADGGIELYYRKAVGEEL
jgi:SPP1 family predicted phage head-tail adaptor